MSHYSVAVFCRGGERDVESLLAPYDENKQCPHYIPKEKIISNAREDFKDILNGPYAQYLNNPKQCAEDWTYSYFDFISKEFPKRINWGDEDFYRHAIKNVNQEYIMPDGSVYDTYNPASKWDWWYPRAWTDGFPTNGALVKDIDKGVLNRVVTYAVVTPDGVWHAPGEMGWFACSTETDDEWDEWRAHYKERFIDTADPNWFMVLIDCHI